MALACQKHFGASLTGFHCLSRKRGSLHDRAGNAPRRPLIVAEPDALTIGEMLAALRGGMGKSARLWPCPLPLLNMIATVTGKHDVIGRVSRPLVARSDALQDLGSGDIGNFAGRP